MYATPIFLTSHRIYPIHQRIPRRDHPNHQTPALQQKFKHLNSKLHENTHTDPWKNTRPFNYTIHKMQISECNITTSFPGKKRQWKKHTRRKQNRTEITSFRIKKPHPPPPIRTAHRHTPNKIRIPYRKQISVNTPLHRIILFNVPIFFIQHFPAIQTLLPQKFPFIWRRYTVAGHKKTLKKLKHDGARTSKQTHTHMTNLNWRKVSRNGEPPPALYREQKPKHWWRHRTGQWHNKNGFNLF